MRSAGDHITLGPVGEDNLQIIRTRTSWFGYRTWWHVGLNRNKFDDAVSLDQDYDKFIMYTQDDDDKKKLVVGSW